MLLFCQLERGFMVHFGEILPMTSLEEELLVALDVLQDKATDVSLMEWALVLWECCSPSYRGRPRRLGHLTSVLEGAINPMYKPNLSVSTSMRRYVLTRSRGESRQVHRMSASFSRTHSDGKWYSTSAVNGDFTLERSESWSGGRS